MEKLPFIDSILFLNCSMKNDQNLLSNLPHLEDRFSILALQLQWLYQAAQLEMKGN